MGAEVVTTASAKNRDFVIGLGADEHINYHETDFADVLSGLDFVFDTQGGATLEKSLEVVRSGGKVSTIAAQSIPSALQSKANARGVEIAMHLVQSNGHDMAQLAHMLQADTLMPTIDKTFEFDALPDAHRYVENGRTVGKVVVVL